MRPVSPTSRCYGRPARRRRENTYPGCLRCSPTPTPSPTRWSDAFARSEILAYQDFALVRTGCSTRRSPPRRMPCAPTSRSRWPQSSARSDYAEAPVRRHPAGDLRVLRRRQGHREAAVPRRLRAGQAVRQALGGISDGCIDDIETLIVAAQKRGDVVGAPSTVGCLHVLGADRRVAHRRLTDPTTGLRRRGRRLHRLAAHRDCGRTGARARLRTHNGWSGPLAPLSKFSGVAN